MDKPKMKYTVVSGVNPRTQASILRPVITDRTTYYVDQVVEYALNAGYMRGQFNETKGQINGFIEAIKTLISQGYAVNLQNWLRFAANLQGTVGEDRQLTSANTLRTAVTSLTDLKVSAEDFSFENVDDTGLVPKVSTIGTKGGELNIWKKNGVLIATGKNLEYSSTLGDTMTVTWDGLASPLALTPSSSDYGHFEIAFPSAMADVEDDTELIFVAKFVRGLTGTVYTITKTLTFDATT